MLLCRLQKVAPIFHNDVQVGFVHMKIVLRQVNDRAIDLDPVNGNRPIDRAEFTRDGTRSQPDDPHLMHLACCKGCIVEKRGDQKVVPGTPCKHLVRVVDRMHPYPLVQHQLRLITHTHNLDIVIWRLAFSHQCSPAT